MSGMFSNAKVFNQSLRDWRYPIIRSMYVMFSGASAFDQDLGWCVGKGVTLDDACDKTPCASTSCGVGSRRPRPRPCE